MIRYILCVSLLILLVQTGFSSTKFLAISDIHYGSQNTPGEGHDTDDHLLQLAMNKFTQLAAKVDFILNLGDIPTHGSYPAEEKEIYESIVFQSLYQANETAKPMFYIPGNNDSLLGNYQAFSHNGRSPLNLAKDWNGACAHCENLIINNEHMYDGGYYSSYVMPHNKQVILIALNSTQFMDLSSHHTQYPKQQEDALTQLHWFAEQLAHHHAKQLLIAMHEPPGADYLGNPFWQRQYLEQFLTLLKSNHSHYQEITLLTSHSHMDEIRKISLNKRHNIYAFSTPSISRNHFNNPALKIFTLAKNFSLKDFTTYYTNTDDNWLNDHYYAIKRPESIFPQCHGLHLAACLDSFNNEMVCKNIEAGLFYGVKSNQVDNSACRKTYQIN
jgi:Calcineurin-like phosphoesterase